MPAVLGIAALALAALLAFAGRNGLAFTMTALGTVAAVATLFTGLYPRVMVSSPNFANSLDVSGAASAHYTLAVLTVIALIVTADRPALPELVVLRVPRADHRRGDAVRPRR